jgi:hypothetical protein
MNKKLLLVSLFVVLLLITLPSVSALESSVIEEPIQTKYFCILPELDLKELKAKDNNNSHEPLFFLLFFLKQILRIFRIAKFWLIWRIIKKIIGGEPSDNWWSSDWHYRTQITIDHTKVEGDLINFPLLVSHISSDFSDNAQPDGDDFVFTLLNDTTQIQLSHELEKYDSTSGELIAWVNIPIVRGNEDTIFYLYYGNPTCNSQQNPKSVWDSHFCGVWHLHDFKDSTNNSNDGTNYGTDDIEGKIGTAKEFIEINHDYITLGDMPEPANNRISRATFELWINPRIGTWGNLISKLDTSYEPDRKSYNFNLLKTGEIRFSAQSGTWYPDDRIIRFTSDESFIVNDLWQYLVVVIDLSKKEGVIYYNGEEKDSNVIILGTPPSYLYDIFLDERLGKYVPESSAPHYYNGSMDEVRISKVCRSSDWIKTSYVNYNEPSTFLKFGYEETDLTLYDALIY